MRPQNGKPLSHLGFKALSIDKVKYGNVKYIWRLFGCLLVWSNAALLVITEALPFLC